MSDNRKVFQRAEHGRQYGLDAHTTAFDDYERLCIEQIQLLRREFERAAAPWLQRLTDICSLKPPGPFVQPPVKPDLPTVTLGALELLRECAALLEVAPTFVAHDEPGALARVAALHARIDRYLREWGAR